jgi:hypothetical protein
MANAIKKVMNKGPAPAVCPDNTITSAAIKHKTAKARINL